MEKSEKIALLSAANNAGLSALKLLLALSMGRQCWTLSPHRTIIRLATQGGGQWL